MEELLAQISTIAKSMWRFRWQSLLVAWLVGAVGAVVVFRIPDRYEATAEIFMGKGPKPVNDATAFDAREVIANLGPTIVRPTA